MFIYLPCQQVFIFFIKYRRDTCVGQARRHLHGSLYTCAPTWLRQLNTSVAFGVWCCKEVILLRRTALLRRSDQAHASGKPAAICMEVYIRVRSRALRFHSARGCVQLASPTKHIHSASAQRVSPTQALPACLIIFGLFRRNSISMRTLSPGRT